MRLSFVGDWAPVRPQMGLKGDGVAIGNLECAFADGGVSNDKAYSSVLQRSCMDNIPSGGFAALSVANNHVNDAGNFRETYAELTRRFPFIQFFGTTDKPFATFEHSNIRTLVIACLEPCRSRGNFIFKQEDVTALIQKLRSSQPPTSTFIFICPHWGMEGEYTRYPSPAQLKLAHEWIDAGADAVIGNHSHVPQGWETYRGKPVYYSLGNYDFPLGEIDEVPASKERMTVLFDGNRWCEEYDSSDTEVAVAEASAVIADDWTTWKWANAVGPFNISKNMASWIIRLRKNLLVTLPKFIVWQFLPKTILFRGASLWRYCKT